MAMESNDSEKGPGAILKEKRLAEHQGLSNPASYLGISESLLQALESDNFDYPLLQDKELVRKYYSQYARFLEIPAEEVLSRYDVCLMAKELRDNADLPTSNVFKKISWVMALCLLFGAVELFYWTKHKVSAKPVEFIAATSEQKSLERSINDMVMSELRAEELERPVDPDS